MLLEELPWHIVATYNDETVSHADIAVPNGILLCDKMGERYRLVYYTKDKGPATHQWKDLPELEAQAVLYAIVNGEL